jgi:hypothetical protein
VPNAYNNLLEDEDIIPVEKDLLTISSDADAEIYY